MATLRELADHLVNGNLIHKKFDFSQVNSDPTGDHTIPNCGTAGCALGELPLLEPRITFNHEGDLMIDGKEEGELLIGSMYFKIPEHASMHLFDPGSQATDVYGGVELDGSATKNQVAENIYALLKKFPEYDN